MLSIQMLILSAAEQIQFTSYTLQADAEEPNAQKFLSAVQELAKILLPKVSSFYCQFISE